MFGFLRRKKSPPSTESYSPTPGAAAPEVATPAAPDRQAPTQAAAARLDQPPAPANPVAGPGSTSIAPPNARDVADETRGESRTAVREPAEQDSSAIAPANTPPQRAGWMKRLRAGLSRTRGNLAGLFGGTKIDEALYEELETALLSCDAGFAATEALLEALRARVRSARLQTPEQVRGALRELLVQWLAPLEAPMDIDRAAPLVMMVAGVNGAGKTTSIGKLAKHLQREGKSVLLAAGDTFRAAAREQLAEWGKRNDVQVIAQDGADPAAVAFDAVNAGRARGSGVVIIDTAGRLPTQDHLMRELTKVHRVLGKAMAEAPHEVLLILDGNTGQNMLAQVRAFDAAAPLSGLVITKLDGTARGGALVALARERRERPIPVYFIGVGESIDDLQAFSAAEFADAMLGV
ncbi:MAG: signal recognition particle-docking protein FtsY [Burkholderiaceae bacterium]